MKMKKYRVYGIATASWYIGEFEAISELNAETLAWDDDGSSTPVLCHQCNEQVEVTDCYNLQVEEVK